MPISTLSFSEVSKEIALKFLHSVVVVDDQAYLSKKAESIPEKAEALEKPKRGPVSSVQVESEVVEKNSQVPRTTKIVPENESLDAKTLIDTFAIKGLVCAVLRPDEHEDKLTDKADHATQKSDIVIFDWKIGDEPSIGDTAIGLIKKIVDTDSKDRLRLIAVYTSNPALVEVAEKVKAALSTAEEQANIKGFEVTRGPVKVVIYQKTGGSAQANKDRVVAEADLPDRLIRDFTLMTQGLLSNVALKSLGALRENTHKILSKFSSNLDAPYIAHRILTNPSEEAESHPIPLLTSEFNDVLEDSRVTECVTVDNVDLWLKKLIEDKIINDDDIETMSANEIREAISDLLKNGFKSELSSSKSANWLSLLSKIDGAHKESLSDLTKVLIKDGDLARQEDSRFAILTTLKSEYNNPAPALKLGSIVHIREKGKDKYYVCIQPLCDSVRIDSKRVFPFLKLDNPSTKTPNDFDLVLYDGGTYRHLKVIYTPHLLKQITFKPSTGESDVRATQNPSDNRFYFESEETLGAGGKASYKYVAELKYPHAQRIINNFGYQFSRVGLTESDWLRRMATPSKR